MVRRVYLAVGEPPTDRLPVLGGGVGHVAPVGQVVGRGRGHALGGEALIGAVAWLSALDVHRRALGRLVDRGRVDEDAAGWREALADLAGQEREAQGGLLHQAVLIPGVRGVRARVLEILRTRLEHRRLSRAVPVQQGDTVADDPPAVVHLLVRDGVRQVGSVALAHNHVVLDLVPVLHEHAQQAPVARVVLEAKDHAVCGDVPLPEQAHGLLPAGAAPAGPLDQLQVVGGAAEAEGDTHRCGLRYRRRAVEVHALLVHHLLGEPELAPEVRWVLGAVWVCQAIDLWVVVVPHVMPEVVRARLCEGLPVRAAAPEGPGAPVVLRGRRLGGLELRVRRGGVGRGGRRRRTRVLALVEEPPGPRPPDVQGPRPGGPVLEALLADHQVLEVQGRARQEGCELGGAEGDAGGGHLVVEGDVVLQARPQGAHAALRGALVRHPAEDEVDLDVAAPVVQDGKVDMVGLRPHGPEPVVDEGHLVAALEHRDEARAEVEPLQG
mmetsp:Transcript_111006/g.354006  ORF Transcript_111006/g.354006 Transcript_111006/m.354006 type:complete len:495 (-) Transcript_111006:586-2070(-)